MTSKPVKVSFVIPHKGREEMLKQTLESIASQSLSANQVEVVVVTQNDTLSSDTLPEQSALTVKVVQRPVGETISRLRNTGVQHSTGDYVAFLDADVEIAPNWIEAMLAELEGTPGRALVSAVQRCSDTAPSVEKIRTALNNASSDSVVRFLAGSNLLLRRETFNAVGGFPEHLLTCEDYYFTDRVHGLGELYCSSASSFIHLGEDKEYGAMFKKEIWRGQSNLQSIKGRRVPMSELPSFLVPVWILGFAVLAVLGLLALQLKFTFLCLGMALLPVFIYSWRLHRIAKGKVTLIDALHFYVLYFPARIMGSLRGLIQPVRLADSGNKDKSARPLKVLQFICPTGFYGAERWILTLAKNLDPAEVQCDLAITIEPGFDDLEIARQYEKLGLLVHRVPMKGRFDLSVFLRLRALLKSGEYDIIHTHGYKSDIIGLIAARLAGIKAISTPHGFENADDWKLRAYIGLGNQFLRFFNVVAPLSEQLCKDVDNIGVSPKKVVYIQNGVDLAEVEAQRENWMTNNILKQKKNKRIGFIGQMISRKNLFDLLDIFDRLAQQHDGLELKLLGDGDQRKELEAYAQTLSSVKAIEFLGFRNDRLEWLQSFDLFAMTSTLEGIPRCLMETMAMGVPVAAYNIPGIDQLVHHGSTGVLAPLGDKQALAQQWERVLFDAAFANQLSEQARNFVWQHFSGHRMAQEYAELFQKVLKKQD